MDIEDHLPPGWLHDYDDQHEQHDIYKLFGFMTDIEALEFIQKNALPVINTDLVSPKYVIDQGILTISLKGDLGESVNIAGNLNSSYHAPHQKVAGIQKHVKTLADKLPFSKSPLVKSSLIPAMRGSSPGSLITQLHGHEGMGHKHFIEQMTYQ